MENEYYNDKFNINWANETNSETLTLDKLKSDNFTLIQVNIKDCFENTSENYALDVDDTTGGKNAIGDRLENAKEHFMSGEPMDYPIVEFNLLHDEVAFTNGRHRTLAASHMGCEYIPMLVYNETLSNFKSKVRTKEMDQPLEQAKYVNASEGNLKINWANENESTDEVKELFKKDSHVLLQVNVEKAFFELGNKAEEDLYLKIGRDESLSAEIEEIKEKFLNKESVDFPSMASNKEWDTANMTSGKATAMAAYDLGCKFVPMLVSKTDLPHFQSIVETKSMDERLDNPVIENIENDKKIKSSQKNRMF